MSIETRKCSKCEEVKPLTKEYFHFRKDKKGNNRFRPFCKECHRIKCRQRYKSRDEETKKKDRERYMNTPANLRLYKEAERRAKKKNQKFDISPSDIIVPEFCPVFSDILLDSHKLYACPSLDRLDNTKGYIRGNIRVISHKANSIKGFATAEELYRVAKYAAGEI